MTTLPGWAGAVSVCVSLIVALAIGWRLPRLLADPAHTLRVRTTGRTYLLGAVALGPLLSLLVTWALSTGLESTTATRACLVLILGVLAGATGWLFLIDARVHRLPNRIVGPLAILVLVTAVAAWQAAPGLSLRMLAGAVGLGLFFGFIAVLGRLLAGESMGLGDVKLAVPLGALAAGVEPWAPLTALVVMNVSALVFLLFRWVRTRTRPGGSLAYGPHMLIGTWTAVLAGAPLL
jgi:leader peptidase (prepilin peptidase)/N-methyltransferase